MRQFTIDIHPQLKNVTFTVKNGRDFTDCAIIGSYRNFDIHILQEDIKRVKQFAVKKGNDKSSSRGRWYSHCNGYAMDLIINYKGEASINTYRPYGKPQNL